MSPPEDVIPGGGGRIERAVDPLIFAWCWLSYWLVMVLPIRWRLTSALFPFAGYWAFFDAAGSRGWRWSNRYRRASPPPVHGEGG